MLDFTGVIDGSVINVALIGCNGSTRHMALLKKPAASREERSAS